jgi:phosphatidylglycerophosphate synthase
VITRDVRRTDVLDLELTAAASVQFGLLAELWASAGLHPMGWLAGATYAVIAGAMLIVALRRSGHRTLGPANRVTLTRAILVGGVTALVVDAIGTRGPVVLLVTFAAVALVMDAVDGQVARRTDTVTPLGARFDMEVDAYLILVLSIFVSMSLGFWVLAIGAMRYAFVAAGWVLPWLRSSLPTSYARKTVAAIQGVVLVVATAGVLPRSVTAILVGVALALLVWSFGRDVRWLWRSRPVRSAGDRTPVRQATVADHGHGHGR